MLLNNFARDYRNHFPAYCQIVKTDLGSTILSNHRVYDGTKLVVHGLTKQSKVLGTTKSKYYSIPLTYQGKFKFKPQRFEGVESLLRSHPEYLVRVTRMADNDFPLNVGDIFKFKHTDTLQRPKKPYIKCEKIDPRTGKTKDFKLPLSSRAVFEEMNSSYGNIYGIKDLIPFIEDQTICVELVERSNDQKDERFDLPLNESIVLHSIIVDSAVYISLNHPEAPAFHLPIRTNIYLELYKSIPKSESPLLSKKPNILSMMDRCAENVDADSFQALLTNKSFDSMSLRRTRAYDDNLVFDFSR